VRQEALGVGEPRTLGLHRARPTPALAVRLLSFSLHPLM
jgi:hypothetical protein